MIEKLRDEIIESQKARTELMKWKLILVAALGGASLGIRLKSTMDRNPPYGLLGLVPLVCLYVDAVCIHVELRIMAIGRFIRTGGLGSVAADSIERRYEEYCAKNRPTFSLEGVALALTTLTVSSPVLAIGIFLPDIVPKTRPRVAACVERNQRVGALGILMTLLFYNHFNRRSNELDRDDRRRITASRDREGHAYDTADHGARPSRLSSKVVGKRLAPRLPALDGKTIYLVDCLFDNSGVFMDQLQQWFGEHLPAVDARIIRPKETWADDPGCARPSPQMAMPRFSASAFEARAARRSSGSPRALEEGGVPSVAVPHAAIRAAL